MTLKSLQQYGKGFQLKVLGSLLTDKKFLLNVRDVLSEDYFDADTHKWIISEIIKYFDKYHTTVTMDVLKVELQKIENYKLRIFVAERNLPEVFDINSLKESPLNNYKGNLDE